MDVTTLIAWALLHFLWQGTLVVVGAAIALHLLRGSSATSRYNLGVTALALMAAVPFATAVRLQERAEAPAARLASSGAAAAKPAPLEPSLAGVTPRDGSLINIGSQGAASGIADGGFADRMRLVGEITAPQLVRAWLLGVFVLSVRLLLGWLGVRRLTRIGVQVPAETVRARFEEMSSRVRVSRPVRLIESALVATPAAIGFLRPVLLWPVSLHSGLTVSQIDLLLAHELAHLKRHDYFVNVLQTMVETALFYHPGVWWLSKRIRHERELCCDDVALEVAGDPREYAETLLTLETWRQRPPALAAAASGGDLMARIQRLVGAPAGDGVSRPRWAAFPLALAAIAGVLGLAPAAPARTAPEGQAGFAPKMRATARTPTGPAEPGEVIRFDGSGTLEARIGRAERDAASKRWARYWIGYAVAAPSGGPLLYIDRVVPVSLGNGSIITGHVKFKSAEGVKPPGVPVESVAGPRTSQETVVFLGMNTSAPGAIDRVHAASATLPVHLEGRPVFWLDSADDAASLAWIRRAFPRAASDDLRRDLVALAGAHTDSRLVFETLKGWIESEARDSIRASAAEELGSVPVKEAVVFLDRTARNDRSREVRVEAAEALGEHGDPLATPTLGTLARTARDPEVAREAAESLGERQSPDALDELVSLIWGETSLDVRRESVESLGEFGTPRGVDEIARIAKTHPVEEIRREAIETLEDIDGQSALAALKDLAALHPEADVRRRSIEALFEKGALADGLGAVEQLMRSNDRRSAQTAVELLGNLESKAAIERLGEIARLDARPEIQRLAAESLGGAAPSESALTTLLGLVENHPREEVQRQAVESIGQIEGPETARALEQIARTHRSEQVRVTAVEALDEHRPAMREVLLRLLREAPSLGVRLVAMEALRDTPVPAEAWVWLVERMASSNPYEPREATIRSQLAFLDVIEEKGDAGIDALIQIVQRNKDKEVRRRALEILAESKDPRARKEIARILEK